MATALT